MKSREEFLEKCQPAASGCLEWADQSAKRPMVIWGGKLELVYRVAYALLVGPIPKGMRVLRSCRNKIAFRLTIFLLVKATLVGGPV